MSFLDFAGAPDLSGFGAPGADVGAISGAAAGGLGGAAGAAGAGGGFASMLAPLSIGSTIASAGASALQGVMGFIGGQRQAKAAQQAAVQASEQGGIAADERLLQGDATLGRAATLAAASGGGMGGSTTGILNQIAERSMFNARGAAYRGATEALNDRYMASIDKDNAINSLISGFTGAAGQGIAGGLKESFRQSLLTSQGQKTGEVPGGDYLAMSVMS